MRTNIKSFPLIAIFILLLPTCNLHSEYQLLSVSEKINKIDSHSEAFQALNVRIRDPFILLAPDGNYYLTGTTAGSHWGETIGVKLWRSSDLATWHDMGFVWELYRDAKPFNTWHFDLPIRNPQFKNPLAIWAPEVHFINGTYWITYSMNVGGHSFLKSTSGKPEGPYEIMNPVQTSLIDSHLFQDEDGTVYYCWQGDYIAKMDREMTTIIEEPFQLQHDGNHQMGYEGILIMKFGDIYAHIASGRYGYEPVDSYDLYYATSKHLYGPYGERRKLATNAGHGNLFKDKNGKWWITAFDHEFYDKKTMDKWSLWLVPVDVVIQDNDVVFEIKDNNFNPSDEHHRVVKELAETGPPEEWKGKNHWFRKEKE